MSNRDLYLQGLEFIHNTLAVQESGLLSKILVQR